MSKTFRACDVDPHRLPPPAADELVPAGHAAAAGLAHVVRDTVREGLGL